MRGRKEGKKGRRKEEKRTKKKTGKGSREQGGQELKSDLTGLLPKATFSSSVQRKPTAIWSLGS